MWMTPVRPRAARKRRLLVFLLLVAGWPLLPAQAPDEEVSRVYLDNAHHLYQEGNPDGARSLLQVALEFDPRNSDALYLNALILLDRQETTTQGIQALERALEAGAFRMFHAEEARQRLADALLRIGDVERAAQVIENLQGSARPGSVAARSWLQARLLVRQGRDGEGMALAFEMLERYPEDARFLELIIRESSGVGLREARLLRRYRMEEGEYTAHYRQAILWFMRKSEDPSLVREWGARYFAQGGGDPLASVLLMENGADPSEEIRRFIELGGDREHWLLRRVVTEADRTVGSLQDRLSSFTGTLFNDFDRNDFADSGYKFDSGVLVSMFIDENEDGSPEDEIEFGPDGSVTRAAIASGHEVVYADYPAATSVTFPEVSYRIIPGHLDLTLFASRGAGRGGVLTPLDEMPEVRPANLLSMEIVEERAFMRETSGEAGGRVAERLDEGSVVERAVDENEDGSIDYYQLYQGGVPDRAVRDIDFDGYFEASELYDESGELTEIAVDSDDNGRVDFTRSVGASDQRQWDFNEDGVFDASDIRAGTSALRDQLAVAPDIDDIVRIWSVSERQE